MVNHIRAIGSVKHFVDTFSLSTRERVDANADTNANHLRSIIERRECERERECERLSI